MKTFLRATAPLVLGSVVVMLVLAVAAWGAFTGHADEAQHARLVGLAEGIAALDAPSILDREGEFSPSAAEDAVAWLRAAAPDVDFYVLDLRGRIIAPVSDKIGVRSVSMAPLRRFMDARQLNRSTAGITGDDPASPGRSARFTVAILPDQGEPAGYLYGVFHNPMLAGVTADLRRDLAIQLALWALAAAALLGAGWTLLFHLHARQPVRQLATSLDRQLGKRGFERPETAASKNPVETVEAHLTTLFDHLDSQDAEVEGLSRVRREVLANFTHDLRTPIATVRGYLETLALSEGALSPTQRQGYLEIALRHSERLSRLVDELLELSRLDRCEVAPRLERFRLGELIQDNIQRFRLRAEQAGVRLEAEFDPDVPPVFADVGLMERALENLIGNAIRHCSDGDSVTVRLRLGGRRLLVSVIDTGSGIAPDDLPFVFDRFYRSRQQQGEKGREGVGLGLAITQRIAELHGGQLLVESCLGDGSTFTFSLE
ncbi:MAG: HAMP domain-containing sensor histidine kinase, partial [Acidobacteriota bacterium]